MLIRASILATALLFLPAQASAQPLAIEFRNIFPAPASSTDQFGTPFAISELSGITWQSGPDYLAVMDGGGKVVRLTITLDANGSITAAASPGGLSITPIRDFEGIAYTNPTRNSIFLSEEDTPAPANTGIREFSLADAAVLQTLSIPTVFQNRRSNNGLESLSLRARGSPSIGNGTLWSANEEALSVDGSISSPSNGTTVRLLKFTGASPPLFPAAAAAQHAYLTEPMHGGAISGGRSGLSDLVALPSGRVIALERSLAFNVAGLFQARLYELDFAAATDISALPGLVGQTYTPVAKQLLWSGDVANMEGLALGPRLANGPGNLRRYALIGVVDDGDAVSNNNLVAFVLSGGPGMINCSADFDEDHDIGVPDIFAFLAAWFALHPDADLDNDGSTGVPDIFTFLALWFTGCP